MKIRKIDFYVGALLSYLINKQITPAIFDSCENAKEIRFDTNNGKFNLFVKYSGKPSKSNEVNRRWDIIFTQSELDRLNTYKLDEYNNFVVIVCSNEDLKNTEIVVLEIKNAIKCLGYDNVNSNKRISARIDKGARSIKCYGTALSDQNAISIERNIDKYFQ